MAWSLFLIGVPAAAVVLWWVALGVLPEPVTEEPKVPYRELRSVVSSLVVAGCAVAVSGSAAMNAPRWCWPLWGVVATVGVVLAIVDAGTTWMPKRLAHLGWLLDLGVLLGVDLVWGSRPVVAAVAGGVGSGLLFGLLWLVSRRSFGFGDVRYMPLLGAATGAVSLTTWTAGLLLGSGLLVIHGVADRLVSRRVRVFAWGPAFLAGAVAALWIH